MVFLIEKERDAIAYKSRDFIGALLSGPFDRDGLQKA